ncbi:calcineurin-like phosphoesterase C-terminal domain-containing protein [Adhaeribacter swui]|uniref:Calcineurin-like phosphoesterase C-terminal domain-containing protein n=1 Tax=Adhaeribacter swui TaxID=2086471 RepID=A0A7G7GET1_9BACT|nr:calcineurin-like phosphoesterase family protein [Adhaeribacter swui]QNF35665.1 calcineurin-like phosphoesterase C-terminal domain-containing protein [Adhaeribacter swui]
MFRRNFLKSLGLVGATTALPVTNLLAAPPLTATIQGKVHENGKGIAKVVVSDGFNVTQTDSKGNYRLSPHSNAEFVFISLPSGYQIPHEKGIARFYQPLPKQTQNVDFNLVQSKQDDTKHAFILWADPQIRKEEDAQKLVTQSAPDTAAVVKSLGNVPVHGIGCGDLIFDKFELFTDYMKAVEITGAPFFQVIGNHDMDYSARTDDQSQKKFKSLFGPTYYSFNKGKIHYVVLDDVFFLGAGHRYIGYLTENQLNWLEQDLKFVTPGSTVVVSLHIPTNNRSQKRNNAKEEPIGGVVSNRDHLYKLLQPFKTHILSGHTHYSETWEKDNIMEHNHGTVCGAWWSGDICQDGTPNGYGVYEVNGDELSWYYKGTGQERNYQLRIYPKGSATDRPNDVIVNVWNWDAKWQVEWYEDGVKKGPMTQFTGYDPLAVQQQLGDKLPVKQEGIEPVLTDHLFAAQPSANAKEIKVEVTDRFQNKYSETITLKV